MANEIIEAKEELSLIESKGVAEVIPYRSDYKVTSPMTGTQVTLKRGTDFGVIPGTKSPSLFKSGAEKIVNAYGLFTHYEIVNSIEDPEKPLFFYTVKCELVKVSKYGDEYVFTSGFGSANTYEKRNGRNSAWDAANATLKMAQKRALVSAAISIGGLSSMFTQDQEDQTFMDQNYEAVKQTTDPEAPITKPQITRLYAIGGDCGLNAGEINAVIKGLGYTSTKQITQATYDSVCEAIKKRGEEL